MLFNNKDQIITLSSIQRQLCQQGLADLANGLNNTQAIHTRQRILSPLKEKLQNPDPFGRSTNGMFSIETRANYR